MGLEAGTFISDLVSSWPLPTDRRREGDDHLRLLKTTIKNTFPNINAAVTVTPKQLNSLPPAGMTATITEIRKHVVPKGTIVMWSGGPASIPEGWALCDGATVPPYGVVPDLRGRFILGSSTAHPTNSTGGNGTPTTSIAADHEHVIDPTALSVAQMPPHTHKVYACTGSGGSGTVTGFGFGDVAFVGDNNNLPKNYTSTNNSARAIVQSEGSGTTHTHGMQPAGEHSHTVTVQPPFYALAYIIKVIHYTEPPV